MKLVVPQNYLNGDYRPPRVYLCDTGGKRINELPAYDISLHAKWNSYSELTFSVDRVYTDVLTSETVINPLFDKVESLRIAELENIGQFLIQDLEGGYSDKDTKVVTTFSAEYALSSKYMDLLYINNGAVDSVEVTYEASKYPADTSPDYMYKPAKPGQYDSSEQYFHRVGSDTNNYDYEQIQIYDENAYATHFGSNNINPEDVLYIHGYANVEFYNPYEPGLSLLHHIFNNKLPEWTIGDVDYNLWHLERRIEEERINCYELLTSKIADVFKCVVIFDTLTRRVHFREEPDDGLTEDDEVASEFETDVFISRSNLASEIKTSMSSDNIKTKLKVSGGEGLDIREVNLDRNYIMNLDYYHNADWMEQDLIEAYDDYLKAIATYTQIHSTWVQKWIEAYNQHTELMNAVPVEGNVVLVGDEFKKLYCINDKYQHVNEYTADNTPIYYVANEDGAMVAADPQPTTENFEDGVYYVAGNEDAKLAALINDLNLYHVDEDIDATATDNILLRLKNADNDIATIRIYDSKKQDDKSGFNPVLGYYTRQTLSNNKYEYTKINNINADNYTTYSNAGNLYYNNYQIHITIVRAASGLPETPIIRTMRSWINGDIRTSNETVDAGVPMLKGFKVTYIGTMGAYLVLAKNEAEEENLQDYGVNLLQEKHDIYTDIFTTQTQALFSQEGYKVTVSNTPPSTNLQEGTIWYDSDSVPAKWYILKNSEWQTYTEDLEHRENYVRFEKNYAKLQAVQNVLSQKTKEAQYFQNGYPVDMTIEYKGDKAEHDFELAAYKHFCTSEDELPANIILRKEFNDNLTPIYTFKTPKAEGTFSVYLQGTTPYVSYENSQGVCQMQRDKLRDLTELERFFSPDQWIRLSPLIREDEYTNDNFFFTGYESKEDEMQIYNELVEYAVKELKTLSQPSLEFSMTMANILALPEFKPLIDNEQFALGNFIRVELNPGLVKRSRLLEVQINFSDFSDFSCTFGNLITTQNQIDLHAELMKQAVSAGQKVATSAGEWQKAVDKSNALEQAIAEGLANATLQVGRANNQSIIWDEHGIWGRKLVPGTIDQYEPEQFRMINNRLVFSNDSFKTSKALFGEYTIGDETRWGVLAEYLTAQTIEGKHLIGGSIEIGTGATRFVVNEDGSVQITSNGKDAYASSSAMEAIDDAYRYQTVLTYDTSTVFSDINAQCIITCDFYDNRKPDGQRRITDQIIDKATFTWNRSSYYDSIDGIWNPGAWSSSSNDYHFKDLNKNQIKIKPDDITKNAQFECTISIDEDFLKTLDEENTETT